VNLNMSPGSASIQISIQFPVEIELSELKGLDTEIFRFSLENKNLFQRFRGRFWQLGG
jgi:hypothetical protein